MHSAFQSAKEQQSTHGTTRQTESTPVPAVPKSTPIQTCYLKYFATHELRGCKARNVFGMFWAMNSTRGLQCCVEILTECLRRGTLPGFLSDTQLNVGLAQHGVLAGSEAGKAGTAASSSFACFTSRKDAVLRKPNVWKC